MTEDEEPHYLLDTNIVSELMRYRADFNVLKKLIEHNGDCAICAPVWHKLLYGVYRLPDGLRKTNFEKFLRDEAEDMFPIKNYTKKVAEIFADLRAKLEKIGKTPENSDAEIASVALANRMILATRNVKHFAAIQEVSDLQVENWFEDEKSTPSGAQDVFSNMPG
ncbi:MAG: type II toxin-antitoxin system VapC family toxin [Treponema sp.]|nr:type II toxin-antitoxin system VapC family toxin [Treponema sp.]